MQIDRFNGNDRNHDILGYVDKDVETYYHTYEYKIVKSAARPEYATSADNYHLKDSENVFLLYKDSKGDSTIRITHTIGNEDIYPDMYQGSK